MHARVFLPSSHLALRGLALAAGLLLVTSAACKPQKPPTVGIKTSDGTVVEPPPPPPLEDEIKATTIAEQAGELEGGGQTEAASVKRDELAENFPGTAAGATELERRAIAAAAAGRISLAVELYEKLLVNRPTFERARAVRIAYGELLIMVGRDADAVEILRPIFDSSGGAEQVALGQVLVSALARSEQAREALEIQVALRDNSELSAAEKTKINASARAIVAKQLAFSDAEKLWLDVNERQSWSFLHPILAFKLAKIYYHTRDYERSEKMLSLVVDRYADSEFVGQARDLRERLERRFEVNPRAIGVLLPLSGRFKQYGERSLAAIKLVFGADEYVELVIKDSEGDPTTASRAVEELVLEHHVLAIIGPQFSKTSMAAGLKAEELSVPIFALSHRVGLPEIGPYVFRPVLTIKAQAEALAKLAFEELDMSRFAILFPRNGYGREFAHAFWDAVDSRKGEIRGIESYEHDQTTFTAEVQMLVGRHFNYARPEYTAKLWELRALKLPSHRFKRALIDYVKTMPPVVDFDAIIIPDSGRNVALIAPAVAAQDIVLTRDPKMLKTIKKTLGGHTLNPVTLMGGSTWNTTQMLNSCERYCEEAIFVDGYYPDNPDPKVRDFISKFRAATETEPFLSDAQAYDTAKLLHWIIETSRPKSRDTLRKLLLEQSTFKGVTGPLRFDEKGEAVKELYPLTIKEREIRLWVKPEEPPTG